MKKAICSILVALLLVFPICFVGENVAYAEGKEEVVSKAYDYAKEFVTTESNNVVGYADRMLNRREYLKGVVARLGYDEIVEQKFKYNNQYNNNQSEETANLIVTKKAKTETTKTVIIGTNYDNAEGLVASIQNSQGATSNGTSVGVVLALMEELKDVDLNFNVKFVFFGASELGLLGSRYFVDNMTTAEKNDLLLMINLSGIGAGDNTYLYDDEIHWEHYDYALNKAKSSNVVVSELPVDKKIILAMEGNIGLEYNHQALLNDVTPFIAKRLPTLLMFSGNYVTGGYVQSKQYGTIMQTKDDTMAKFDEIFGNSGKQKMNDAVTLVKAIITDEVFDKIMARSVQNKPDYSFFTTSSAGIVAVRWVTVAVAIIAMVVTYAVLKSRGDKSNDPIKPIFMGVDPFVQANADPNGFDKNEEKPQDPFGLDDDNNTDDNPFGI